MNEFLRKAESLKEELIATRRHIHQLGGTGFDISETADFIQEKLNSFGIENTRTACGGVVALIGKKSSPTILLRADFDALPFAEETGLPFACTNGSCHACGHDMHTTMLIYAGKLLKEQEDQLNGCVKLMFQPAEEIGAGAETMVKEGILENPHVDAAFSLHIAVADTFTGTGKIYYSRGGAYASADSIVIKVNGHGCHGAAPQKGVDPIAVSAHIITALQQLSAREIASDDRVVLTFGSIHGGSAENVIPGSVEIRGTLRTYDQKLREFCVSRIREITAGVASAMRAEADIAIIPSSNAVVNDSALCDDILPFIEEVTGPENCEIWNKPIAYGSEDFSAVTGRVPGIAAKIGVGSKEEGYTLPLHHPSALFNEDAMTVGTAVNAAVAFGWVNSR